MSFEVGRLFSVKTPQFEGPIDLLLHLVKSNELPIEKVSLAEVANQYLECLDVMRVYDLEVAGEYLVIAATLVSIKSSVLLREPVVLVQDEDGNMVNPHDELLRKLREAAVYKDAALELSERAMLDLDVFSGPDLLRYVESEDVQYLPHDAMLLGKAFRKVLERLSKSGQSLTITLDSVSIVDRMMKVLDQLDTSGGTVTFSFLVQDITTRGELIGTFVALLELCKRGVITVSQELVDGDIAIIRLGDGEKSEGGEFVSEFVSEFDTPDIDGAVNA